MLHTVQRCYKKYSWFQNRNNLLSLNIIRRVGASNVTVADWLQVSWRSTAEGSAQPLFHPKHPSMNMTFKNICSKLKKHSLRVSGVMGTGPFVFLYSSLTFPQPLTETNVPFALFNHLKFSRWFRITFLERYARNLDRYLFDWQRDVLQYAVLYFQLIHHWSAGSPHTVSWLPRCSSALVLLLDANAARSS